jgi:tetratricopeptide (TPR) repeat protein
MSLKIKILFLFFIFVSCFMLRAQNPKEIDNLEIKMQQLKTPVEKITLLLNLTDSLSTIQPDQSMKYAQQALDLSVKQNYNAGRLMAMNRIADIYWGKTDFNSSLKIANEAKELAVQIDNQNEYAKAILIIGKVYTDLGDYDKSSEMNFEALKIFEKENNKIGVGSALNRIGYVYFDQENWDKALEYYSRSLKLAREINDLVGISRGLNNVAAVYGNKKEYSNLEKNLMEAVEINRKTGQKLWEGINYMNLAALYEDQQKYDTAFYYYEYAVSIFKELNNVPKIAAVYMGLSNYFYRLNDIGKSLFYAEKTYKLGEDNKLKLWVYKAAKRMHELYFEKNDVAKAYEYSLVESRMKDSLDMEKSMTRLSQLELLYEFEKINQEKIIKQQRKDYLFVITVTILVSLFVIIIILLLTRQRIRRKNALMEKKQLESKLEIKNKELASNVMSLMRKNEVLSEMGQKLMVIQDEAVKDETKSAIKRIAVELEKNTDSEIWDEFEIRFKQVHGAFYERLNNKFPDLSPNEQKICAFLRLNMSTKEISELTGQRVNTIEIARTRLRKKLQITNTKINLISFLSKV